MQSLDARMEPSSYVKHVAEKDKRASEATSSVEPRVQTLVFFKRNITMACSACSACAALGCPPLLEYKKSITIAKNTTHNVGGTGR